MTIAVDWDVKQKHKQKQNHLLLAVYKVQILWERSGRVTTRVLASRPRGSGFEPGRRYCVVSLSKNINPSLVLVQPRKTRPFINERLLMGRKELNLNNYMLLAVYKVQIQSPHRALGYIGIHPFKQILYENRK